MNNDHDDGRPYVSGSSSESDDADRYEDDYSNSEVEGDEDAEVLSDAVVVDDVAFIAEMIVSSESVETSELTGTKVGFIAPLADSVDQGNHDEDEDDGDEDEELEEVMKLGAELRKMDGDDDDDTPGEALAPRTKNEVQEDLVEEDDEILINPSDDINEIGTVSSVILGENTIVVKAISTSSPLVEGSVLSLHDKTPLGRIFEIFGPVSSPFYVVKRRLSFGKQAASVDLNSLLGQSVYAVLKSVSYITPT